MIRGGGATPVGLAATRGIVLSEGMHYVGVAIDASARAVRIVVIDRNTVGDPPDFRVWNYGEGDELPSALRDLHTATANMLGELSVQAFGVRRQEVFDADHCATRRSIDWPPRVRFWPLRRTR